MNYLNPKTEVRHTIERGRGLFAKEKIFKGETIEKTTEGIQILTKAEIAAKPDAKLWKSLCYEVGGDKEECPIDIYNPPASFLINHTCDPNVGVGNDMVAMRDIEANEELTYDYVMTDSGDYDVECTCGSKYCRGRRKGTDWMRPELQERYKGYFAKNIQEKIDKLKQI
jgi:hypothetical protein